MPTEQQERMHSEHRVAESELESWVDDIYMWSAEHKQALAWLSQIEAAIHEHDVELQQHRSTIDRLERHIRQHEHEIAWQEQRSESQDDTVLARQHEEFNQKHAEVKDVHARIGEHHRKHIAELHRLKEHFLDAT